MVRGAKGPGSVSWTRSSISGTSAWVSGVSSGALVSGRRSGALRGSHVDDLDLTQNPPSGGKAKSFVEHQDCGLAGGECAGQLGVGFGGLFAQAGEWADGRIEAPGEIAADGERLLARGQGVPDGVVEYVR
jgi:hypothetical protein